MKQKELIDLIQNPQLAVHSDIRKLVELRKQFPFFQSAHVLLTIIAKKYDSGLFQQTLKQTAISIPNRARLHSLLHVPEKLTENPVEENVEISEIIDGNQKKLTNTDNQSQHSELDYLKAIELSSEKKSEEKLNEEVEKHIQKDIVNAFVEKEILKTPDWFKKEKINIAIEKSDAEIKKTDEKEQVQLDKGTFSDWLQEMKKADRVGNQNKETSGKQKIKDEIKEDKSEAKKNKEEEKNRQKSIIDSIIEKNPSKILLNPNRDFYAANVKAKESLIENEDLVTETLAKIYAIQGNISKAVRAYEILSLKFPQKSAYFATLIQNLKETESIKKKS